MTLLIEQKFVTDCITKGKEEITLFLSNTFSDLVRRLHSSDDVAILPVIPRIKSIVGAFSELKKWFGEALQFCSKVEPENTFYELQMKLLGLEIFEVRSIGKIIVTKIMFAIRFDERT